MCWERFIEQDTPDSEVRPWSLEAYASSDPETVAPPQAQGEPPDAVVPVLEPATLSFVAG